jgi:uncharacterized protein YndB with AHSA1/START domain
MPEILLEVPTTATPDKVYEALTTQQGLARWWTPEVVAKPAVGSVAEFVFPGGYMVKMGIAALEPGRAVQWTVQQGAPDWAGTRITWDLTPVEGGTRIRFGHREWASTEGSFPYTAWNWAWYLTSLKEYLETGRGRPGQLPV